MVRIRALEKRDIETVSAWLQLKDNNKWLDFGAGRQVLSSMNLGAQLKSGLNDLQAVIPDDSDGPIGLVAVANIARAFRSGTLWYVIGDTSRRQKGCATEAVGLMLNRAFGGLGLMTINAWVVDRNVASIRVLEKNGFRRIGVQRQCHVVDGVFCNRVLFDKTAGEHQGKARRATAIKRSGPVSTVG